MPTYKDINSLSQKTTPSGAEKIPVSDTQYLNVSQIAHLDLPVASSSDSGKYLSIDSNGKYVKVLPTIVYVNSVAPQSSLGNDGDIFIRE